MTVMSENTISNDINDNVSVIVHESYEACQEYLLVTENLKRAEDTIIEKVKLAKESKQDKHLGKAVIIRGLPWKLYLCQNYCINGEKYLYASIYCDANLKTSWSCNTRCRITVVNNRNEQESLTYSFSHFFFFKEFQHLCPQLINMRELYRPDNPYVNNGAIELRVFIQAEAPHGIMWDSKRVTGYVGLRNEGATCYLNSLLQTIYFCEPLRKVIYKVPTEILDCKTSVVSALQFIFYDLQRSNYSVDTKRLIRAFGWDSRECYVQHDVQEMCRILLDKVEEKMKGTIVENGIAKLLEGKLISYIKCINVDYESKREETFYDIQLNVKDKKNIYESFNDYVAEELFVEDNKYNAGQHGLQDAKKGIVFKTLPPILHLHLLRFQYDPFTNVYYKVHDRYEFPKELHLQKYMLDASLYNPEDPYLLQSVLVHSGEQNGGHYVVFISPRCDDTWFKFDDDVVSQVTAEEAIDNNFGFKDGSASRSPPTAYMLGYIHLSALNNPDLAIDSKDIPEHLYKLYEEEIECNKMENMFRNDKHNYQEIQIAFDDQLYEKHTGSTVDFSKLRFSDFTVNILWKIGDLVNQIATHMNVPSDSLRLWNLREKHGFSLKPIYIGVELSKYNLKTFCQRVKPIFFIQKVNPQTLIFTKHKHLLFFTHYFLPETQSISYTGILQISSSVTWNDLLQQFITIYTPVESIDDLIIFYEMQQNILHQIDNLNESLEITLNNRDLDCESIVIQKKVNFLHTQNATKTPTYPFQLANDYLNDTINHIHVKFYDVNIPQDEPTFVLNLSKYMKYEHYIKQISIKLGVSPEFIRLFKAKATRCPAVPIKSNSQGFLDDIFISMNRVSEQQRLYYLILKMPVSVIEDKSMFYIAYSISNYHISDYLSMFIGVKDSLETIKHEAYEAIIREGCTLTHPIRIVDYSNNKLSILCTEAQTDYFFTDVQSRKLRIEEIPDDQVNMKEFEYLVCVNYKSRTQYLTSLKPFFIKISPESTYLDLYNQIKEYSEAENYEIKYGRSSMITDTAFPDDLSRLFCLDEFTQMRSNGNRHSNVLDTLIFSLQLSESPVVSQRSYRGDHSIRIHN